MSTMQLFYRKLRAVKPASHEPYLRMLQKLTRVNAGQVKAMTVGLEWQSWGAEIPKEKPVD